MSIFTEPYQHSYPPVLYTAPVLSGIAPTTGSVGVSTTVSINGTGFHPGSVALVNGVAEPTTYISPTQVRVTFTPASAGAVTITVANGGQASNGQTFNAAAEDAPTSTSSKADIVAWLLSHGVDLSADALTHMSKAELLELVADLLNDEEG